MFYRFKNFSTCVVCDRSFLSDGMRALLDDPEKYLQQAEARTIQDNFKNKIVYFEIDKKKAVIKIHKYKSAWHRIKRYFRQTRANRSWAYSLLFNAHGIPTPQPIAYKESRIGPLRGDSYFIYEWVEGINGEEYFTKNKANPEIVEKAIDAIVDMTRTIKKLGLIHGDIRLKNMVFRGDDLLLIDFDDTKKRQWYKSNYMNNRDFRGLIEDIYYNVPPEIQPLFLSRLESVGDDIRKLVRSYKHRP